jgi:hypothetical protein
LLKFYLQNKKNARKTRDVETFKSGNNLLNRQNKIILCDNFSFHRYTLNEGHFEGIIFLSEGATALGQIIEIKGKVKFKITLDPGVWIFDDRRIDLDTYFAGKTINESDIPYEEKLSHYWDREIREGSVSPPTLKTEKKYEKEKLLTGTFGIIFEPFLNNAEPLPEATRFVIETKNGKVAIPLNEAKDLIFKFSENGSPLKTNGPVHILFKDGSNLENPITDVLALIIE